MPHVQSTEIAAKPYCARVQEAVAGMVAEAPQVLDECGASPADFVQAITILSSFRGDPVPVFDRFVWLPHTAGIEVDVVRGMRSVIRWFELMTSMCKRHAVREADVFSAMNKESISF
jgi:hypothetical protein